MKIHTTMAYVTLVCLGLTVACEKGADDAAEKTPSTPTPAQPAAAADVAAAANAQPTDKTTAKTQAASSADFKTYKNDEQKFSVASATSTPRESPLNLEQPGIKIEGRSYMFPFRNSDHGIGLVTTFNAVTTQPYDIDGGLDGSVEQAVAAVGGKITLLEKKSTNGHPARQFDFTATANGRRLVGKGHAIGVGPKRISSAIAAWIVGNTVAETEGKKFVESFEAR